MNESAPTKQARASFEAFCSKRWAGDRGAFGTGSDGEYLNSHIQFAWLTFCAGATPSGAIGWVSVEERLPSVAGPAQTERVIDTSSPALRVLLAEFEAAIRADEKSNFTDISCTELDRIETTETIRTSILAFEAPAEKPAPAGPAGWKLVPVELTEEMHAAAVRTIVRCTGNADVPPRVYRAMLAAAPAWSPALTLQ